MSTFTADIQISVNDLLNFAGTTYDVSELSAALPQAVATIETISGVFFEAIYREVVITTGDAGWLKRAAAYQALFLVENSDITSRPAVESLTQDGVHVRAYNELTFVLAPLAKRALNNCSWAKSGTLKVAIAEPRTSEDFLVSDDHPWTPLAGI